MGKHVLGCSWLLYALDRWPDYNGTDMFNLNTL